MVRATLMATTDEIKALRDLPGASARPPTGNSGGGDIPATFATGFMDFSNIVSAAADRFEREYPDVIVTAEARQVLANRALEHEADVYQALQSEQLSGADLENAAHQQFLGAHTYTMQRADVAGGRSSMNAEDVEASMQDKCWFVGWC